MTTIQRQVVSRHKAKAGQKKKAVKVKVGSGKVSGGKVTEEKVSGGKAIGEKAGGGKVIVEKSSEKGQGNNDRGSHETTIFGNISDKPENQMTAIEKMHMVDGGLSKENLEQLKEKAELDYDELATIFSVARATLINKKGQQKFGPLLSEKIMGLADLYSYGYEVFEDKDRFNRWMFRPNRALGEKAPYELIHNQFGREEVRNLIGRIEYGVY
jgi:putative toxin-antitoxin system antitoxin component (TIGR02293 family)